MLHVFRGNLVKNMGRAGQPTEKTTINTSAVKADYIRAHHNITSCSMTEQNGPGPMEELKPWCMKLPCRFFFFNIQGADTGQNVRRCIFWLKTGYKPGMDHKEGIFGTYAFTLDEKRTLFQSCFQVVDTVPHGNFQGGKV